MDKLLINISNQMANISVKGGTYQVKAAILPEDAEDKSLEWALTNDDIATVDQNGLVTAKKNGTVTVVAMAQDGSDVFGELEIVITGQKVLITSIILT